ncbi:hypothetical protein GE061_001413 [Apolygus lucorum]|uniref:Uncharacterized protein n=1 Tax=Apolygus lucorum TaxID=248454 RepID=A0A8S9Y707_APOLU|nr:hypothetical protein GE061_001413 [Apolygus lucorum]
MITNYYGFPYDDNEYDIVMTIVCSSMLQWLAKTEQTIPHPTLPTVVIKWTVAAHRTIHRAIELHNTDRVFLMYDGATSDMMLTDYKIRVEWSCPDTTSDAFVWCEQPEVETPTNGEFSNMFAERGKIVPQTLAISNKAWPIQQNALQRAWIIRSLSDDNSDMPPQSVSPLILPDPIDW